MTTKTFDSVKLMRELRDNLSQEMEHMTAEERLRYIREKAASTGLGRKMAEDDRDADRSRAPVIAATVLRRRRRAPRTR
jgi:uncharacterized protein YbcC (UPF0753/DUF2309 family)